ncbi:hypothetical protein JXA70_11795 [candidate division KSB1 bacterium]|nr:hypothetical protein [candidate division KSB1 bacterium]
MRQDRYDTSFGYFQKNGAEFVVTELNTPRALVNYFWNFQFISGISHHGGGEGCYKERTMQYIDPRGRNEMIRDMHRYFYLRDEKNGLIWSPGWHPVHEPVDRYTCTHGLGYSILQSSKNNIETKFRVFVPENDPCEIWTITISNKRPAPATIKMYSFADWLLLGYPRYCDYFGMLTGEYFADIYAAQGCNRAAERTHDIFDGFVASDLLPSGFETSQREFLGPYGFVNRPEAVVNGKLKGTLASCENLASTLEHTIELAPGQSITFNIFIGASNGYEMTKELVTRLSRSGEIECEFVRLWTKKQDMIKQVRIRTPDARVNFLINGWIKQQIQVYADVGSDNGRGFRDAMQLLWATASYDRDYTRRMLKECLSHQFADGHTLRGWLPIDDHHYSDGPVWITPVVDAYLKETGEVDLLDEIVPFYDAGEGTIWEHVLRGLRHGSDDVGQHGLTKCHFGDWNDSLTGVGIKGRGESVWTTMGIIYGLKLASRIARVVKNDMALADDLTHRAECLQQAVDEFAWDGEWYLRAINDYNEKVGSRSEAEGFIYLLPQVWAIVADMVDEKRRQALYRAVDGYLDTITGSRTLYPPYTRYNPRIGRVTLMTPGIWENGTAYCHANGFKIIADCLGGRGDEAFTSFKKAMPDSEWNASTHSGCEPYVLTNQFLGPENRRAGKSLWAWMTGAAGWYYRAMTEWIIGVRAEFDGLLIDPCLPHFWQTAELERTFRGARYHIIIENPKGLQKGDIKVILDDKPHPSHLLPIFNDYGLHQVKVVLD